MDTNTLIWLFPIAFMCHDFEEIILGEPWLRKNTAEITERIKNRVPVFVEKQISTVFKKSASELTFSISLIFALTVLASFLAAVYGQYGPFFLASGLFFLHGFMHIGQAILLRRYVPALISSVLIILPYGGILYRNLFANGILDMRLLGLYFLIAAPLIVPFILVMHLAGEFLYQQAVRVLIGPAGQ